MVAKHSEFGKYQKGEDKIICTYNNVDEAKEAIMKKRNSMK
ncbi:MAG: hypothetical protein WA799_03455 [Nitrosotalea sp.]